MGYFYCSLKEWYIERKNVIKILISMMKGTEKC